MIRRILLLIPVVLFLIACGGTDDNGQTSSSKNKIVGEWHLASWNGNKTTDFDAYISFNSDQSFVIYQQIESVKYQKFSGRFSIKKEILSGIYSDGAPWGSDYLVKLSNDNATLTLTSKTGIEEVSVYVRATIPEQVKGSSINVSTASRSSMRLL